MANTKGPRGNIALNFHEPVKTSVNTGEDKKMYQDIALNKSILLDIYSMIQMINIINEYTIARVEYKLNGSNVR